MSIIKPEEWATRLHELREFMEDRINKEIKEAITLHRTHFAMEVSCPDVERTVAALRFNGYRVETSDSSRGTSWQVVHVWLPGGGEK